MDQLLERVDRVCFEHRDALLIPCALPIAIALAFPVPVRIDAPIGVAVAGAGCGLRLWAVRSIGKRARVRHASAQSLLVAGPYARVRNPLYLANALLTLGLCLVAGAGWSSLLALLLLSLVYARVVAHEEVFLTSMFGPEYAAYSERIPRWIPRLRPASSADLPPPWPWSEVLAREKSVILGVPAACAAAWAVRAGAFPLESLDPSLKVIAIVVTVIVAMVGCLIGTKVKRRRHRAFAESQDVGPSR